MRARLAKLALTTLALCAAAGVSVAMIGGTDERPTQATLPSFASIDVPAAVPAGGTLTGTIVTDNPGIVELFAAGHTTEAIAVRVIDGAARFELGPPHTDRAGVISLLIATGAGMAHATVTVEPGAAATIDPLAGPRTIVADGRDQTMVVTVPTDAMGNSLPDGTTVEISVTAPDGGHIRISSETEGGLAAARIPSTSLAGPVAISATSGNATGPAVRIDQVAGAPVPFSVHVAEGQEQLPLVADGRSLHRLVTDRLVDEFGNVLPDGVSMDISVESPLGPGHLVAVVIGGHAQFNVEAPSTPGPVTVGATVDGVRATPVVLTFASAVDRPPVQASIRDGLLVVEVGPVLDRRGAFVPDGTMVVIGNTTAVIQDGVAAASLALPQQREIEVSVLGATSIVEVPSWS